MFSLSFVVNVCIYNNFVFFLYILNHFTCAMYAYGCMLLQVVRLECLFIRHDFVLCQNG